METGGQVSVKKIKWYLLEFIWDLSGKYHLANSKAHLSLQTQEVEK